MKTKIWSIVLTICMLVSVVPMNVSAEGTTNPDTIVEDTMVEEESVVSEEPEVIFEEIQEVTEVTEAKTLDAAAPQDVDPIEITEIKFTVDNLPKKAGDTVVTKDKLKYTIENEGCNLVLDYWIYYEGEGAAKEIVEGQKAKTGVGYIAGFEVTPKEGYKLAENITLTTNASAGAYVVSTNDQVCKLEYCHALSVDELKISDIDAPIADYELDTEYKISPEMDLVGLMWYDATACKQNLEDGYSAYMYDHVVSGKAENGKVYGFYAGVITKMDSGAKVTFNGTDVPVCSFNEFDWQEWFKNCEIGNSETYIAVYDDQYGYLEIYALFKEAKIKPIDKLDVEIDAPVLYGTPDMDIEITPSVQYKSSWLKVSKGENGEPQFEEMYYYSPNDAETFVTDTVYAACISSQTVLDENVKVYLDGAEVEIFKPTSNESYFSALKSLYELNADGTKKAAGAFVGQDYIEIWVFYEKFEDLVSGEDVKGYPVTIDNPDEKDSLYEYINWNEDYDSNTAYREDSSHKDIVITVKWAKDNKNKRPENLPIQVFTYYDGQLVDFISGESAGIGYQFEQRKTDTQWTYYFLQNTPQQMLSLRSVPVTEFEEGEAYFTFETPEGYTASVDGNTITLTAKSTPKKETPKKTETLVEVEEPEVIEVVMVQAVPPTSDQSNVLGWNTLLAASALGFIVAFKCGRKRRTE